MVSVPVSLLDNGKLPAHAHFILNALHFRAFLVGTCGHSRSRSAQQRPDRQGMCRFPPSSALPTKTTLQASVRSHSSIYLNVLESLQELDAAIVLQLHKGMLSRLQLHLVQRNGCQEVPKPSSFTGLAANCCGTIASDDCARR